MKKRYEDLGILPGRAMLEHLFGECGGEDELIAMVRNMPQQAKPTMAAWTVLSYGRDAARADAGRLQFLLHSAGLGGAHTKISVRPAQRYLAGGSARENCLIAIDILRDEYGVAANDTRHPDVLSERPWPIEAGPTPELRVRPFPNVVSESGAKSPKTAAF